MDPAELEAAITPRTKAIIPIHLYGQPADLGPILEIARRHGIRVIEDCAQVHGGRYEGRPVGSWGDLACFSFYPTKNLGAIGDGGMIETSLRVKLARLDEKNGAGIRIALLCCLHPHEADITRAREWLGWEPRVEVLPWLREFVKSL